MAKGNYMSQPYPKKTQVTGAGGDALTLKAEPEKHGKGRKDGPKSISKAGKKNKPSAY